MLATVTDWLWSYVLIAALLLVGLRLTWDARFVQLRLFKEMFRGLSGGFSGTDKGLSSFQALVVSVAGRVGGGNIAGVAVAITLGGPGASVLDVVDCADWHGHQFVRVRACPALQAKRWIRNLPGWSCLLYAVWTGLERHAGDLFGAFTRDHWLWV